MRRFAQRRSLIELALQCIDPVTHWQRTGGLQMRLAADIGSDDLLRRAGLQGLQLVLSQLLGQRWLQQRIGTRRAAAQMTVGHWREHHTTGGQHAFDLAARDLPGERSVSNSAALLRHPEQASDWVRAGIALYGGAPDFPLNDITRWDLQPAMTLRSRLIGVQQLLPGDSVGYGSSFRADQPMRIGIVACGYADGYPRHCGSGTPVLVDGRRCVTVGRVSMDMLAVDLSTVPAADLGSEVTLWGRGPNGSLLAIDEVAQAAGTIGYELMCALAPRVPVHPA